MLLSDLSLSQNASSANIKAALEEKLGAVLPKGSYTVILRSYQGDFRVRHDNQINYKTMFLLEPAAKKAVLEHKDTIEQMGFRVSSTGDITTN